MLRPPYPPSEKVLTLKRKNFLSVEEHLSENVYLRTGGSQRFRSASLESVSSLSAFGIAKDAIFFNRTTAFRCMDAQAGLSL